MKKLLAIVCFVVMAGLALTACDKKNKDTTSSEIQVYYLDSKTSEMVSEAYKPLSSSKDHKVEELLQKLKESPKNMLYKSALPENVTIKEFQFSEEGQLTIDFDTTYNNLSGIDEVLCRSAIVKTLTQIHGVEFVSFSIDGKPLTDGILMTDSEFVLNPEEVTDYKVSLYFGDEKGKGLIESITNINYSGNASIEELVIQQLINGPTEIGMKNTIPEGTTLLNVTTKDGVCVVDFNEKFLDKVVNVTDDVTIYSIVNSLVNIPNRNISKVQFKINGEIQKTYHEKIPFDGYFERNLALIDDTQ